MFAPYYLLVELLLFCVSAESDDYGTAYAAVQKQDGESLLIIYLKNSLKPAI